MSEIDTSDEAVGRDVETLTSAIVTYKGVSIDATAIADRMLALLRERNEARAERDALKVGGADRAAAVLIGEHVRALNAILRGEAVAVPKAQWDALIAALLGGVHGDVYDAAVKLNNAEILSRTINRLA